MQIIILYCNSSQKFLFM